MEEVCAVSQGGYPGPLVPWQPCLQPSPCGCHYLLLLDDADAGLDVGEGVHGS